MTVRVSHLSVLVLTLAAMAVGPKVVAAPFVRAEGDTTVRIGLDLLNGPLDVTANGNITYVLYPAGFQIIDRANPFEPDSLTQVLLDGEGGNVLVRGDFLFVTRGSAGLFTFDVQDPALPVPVDTIAAFSSFGVMDTMKQRLFVADRDSGFVSIYIIDPTDPVLLNRWPFDNNPIIDFVADGNVAYIATERSGIELLNVTDFTVAELGGINIDLVEHLAHQGEDLFASIGAGGLIKIDVSDPEAPSLDPDAYAVGDSIHDLTLVDSLLVVSVNTAELIMLQPAELSSGPLVRVALESEILRVVPVGSSALVTTVNSGVVTVDVVEPEGTSFLSRETFAAASLLGFDLVGDTAFVATQSHGIVLIDLANERNPETIDSIKTGNVATSVVVIDSVVYVTEGSNSVGYYTRDGVELGHLQLGGQVISLDRKGPALYVSAGLQGLVVIDVSNPTSPLITDTISVSPAGGAAQRADVEGDILVMAQGNAGVQFLDVSDPLHPVSRSFWDSDLFISDAALTGTLALAVQRQGGVVSLDISDPGSPLPLDTLEFEAIGLFGIDAVEGLAYMIEWRGQVTPGNIHIISTLDPSRLRRTDIVQTSGPPSSIRLKENLILVSEGRFGFEIFASFEDFSLIPVGAHDPVLELISTAGSDQRLVVGDNGGNFWSFGVLPGDSLVRHSSINLGGSIGDIVVSDRRAFVVVDGARVVEVDITNVNAMSIVRNVDLEGGSPGGLFLLDSLLYVAADQGGLQIYDISSEDFTSAVGGYLTEFTPESDLILPGAHRVVVANGIAYVATRSQSPVLFMIDVSNPSSPAFLSSYDDNSGRAFDVSIWNGYAYLARRQRGITVVDVREPTRPDSIETFEDMVGARRIEIADGILFAARRGNGFSILDVQNVAQIQTLHTEPSIDLVRDISLFGTFLGVCEKSSFSVFLQGFASVDEIAPSYSLGIVPSAFANAYVDFIVAADEVLAARPNIRFQMGEVDSMLPVFPIDVQRGIYHSTYRMTEIGFGTIEVDGEDLAGNKSLSSKNFSLSVARGARGGTIVDTTGKVEIVIPPGKPTGDTYFYLIPEDGLRARLPEGAQAQAGPYRLTLGDLDRGVELHLFGLEEHGEGGAPGLFRLSGTLWEEIPASYDFATGRLDSELPGSTIFAVFGKGGAIPVPPLRLLLGPNRPNPFNPATSIEVSLNRDGRVRLVVYDVRGRIVRELIDGALESGVRTVIWDGRDRSGRHVASGLYFSRLEAFGEIRTQKMMLVR